MTVLVFLLPELSTELKNAVFNFLNLVKSTSFCSKTLDKHYIYEFLLLFFFFGKIDIQKLPRVIKIRPEHKKQYLSQLRNQGKVWAHRYYGKVRFFYLVIL